MPTARILDAAGPTVDFWFETGDLTPVLESATRLSYSAPILSGPMAGRTSRFDLFGTFDPDAGTGFVKEMRESVAGQPCFSFVFERPVAVDRLFSDDPSIYDNMRFFGNNFANDFTGEETAERMNGLGGNDILYGAGGNDTVAGGNGNDYLAGNLGFDTLIGGNGNDILDGRTNSFERMLGGAGNDVYLELNNNGGDIVYEVADAGYDIVRSLSQGFTLPENVEELRMEGSYANFVNALGNAMANVILGSTGRDFVNAFEGNDTVSGGAGDDALLGAAGNDMVSGGSGADELNGNDGGDVLSGGLGADSLEGGLGKDVLTGGDGRDVFLFRAPEDAGIDTARDVILDFVRASDRIDLSYMDANLGAAGNQAFSFVAAGPFTGAGQVTVRNGLLSGNVDGDLAADFQVLLAGITDLGAADLVL